MSHLATDKVQDKGKQFTTVDLQNLQEQWELYWEHFYVGDKPGFQKYLELCESLTYEAHFTQFIDGKWKIENERGLNSWTEFNPTDYFEFEVS